LKIDEHRDYGAARQVDLGRPFRGLDLTLLSDSRELSVADNESRFLDRWTSIAWDQSPAIKERSITGGSGGLFSITFASVGRSRVATGQAEKANQEHPSQRFCIAFHLKRTPWTFIKNQRAGILTQGWLV
jgi:hypothetical protein